eukprot:Cvel_25445.t1-p1 / transcript=Cvel_25445.t1 / gene=Cvel_25445 / organism=Chromera_velia_CCMP2878 / gene_product=hypothetical protein / transcript_product=hypothetical protein / location=Cvel_scaffold2884:2381-11592(-) / protein_length=1080 / sequence_SO=supercontig / SO=protein_coding / is_pseudo=false
MKEQGGGEAGSSPHPLFGDLAVSLSPGDEKRDVELSFEGFVLSVRTMGKRLIFVDVCRPTVWPDDSPRSQFLPSRDPFAICKLLSSHEDGILASDTAPRCLARALSRLAITFEEALSEFHSTGRFLEAGGAATDARACDGDTDAEEGMERAGSSECSSGSEPEQGGGESSGAEGKAWKKRGWRGLVRLICSEMRRARESEDDPEKEERAAGNSNKTKSSHSHSASSQRKKPIQKVRLWERRFLEAFSPLRRRIPIEFCPLSSKGPSYSGEPKMLKQGPDGKEQANEEPLGEGEGDAAAETAADVLGVYSPTLHTQVFEKEAVSESDQHQHQQGQSGSERVSDQEQEHTRLHLEEHPTGATACLPSSSSSPSSEWVTAGTFLEDVEQRRAYLAERKAPQVLWMVQQVHKLLSRGQLRTETVSEAQDGAVEEGGQKKRILRVLDVGGGRGDLAVALCGCLPALLALRQDVRKAELEAPSKRQGTSAEECKHRDRKTEREERPGLGGGEKEMEVVVEVHVVEMNRPSAEAGQARAQALGLKKRIIYHHSKVEHLDRTLLQRCHLIVALHACGGLSDLSLALSLSHGVPFLLTPCCALSHPHLRSSPECAGVLRLEESALRALEEATREREAGSEGVEAGGGTGSQFESIMGQRESVLTTLCRLAEAPEREAREAALHTLNAVRLRGRLAGWRGVGGDGFAHSPVPPSALPPGEKPKDPSLAPAQPPREGPPPPGADPPLPQKTPAEPEAAPKPADAPPGENQKKSDPASPPPAPPPSPEEKKQEEGEAIKAQKPKDPRPPADPPGTQSDAEKPPALKLSTPGAPPSGPQLPPPISPSGPLLNNIRQARMQMLLSPSPQAVPGSPPATTQTPNLQMVSSSSPPFVPSAGTSPQVINRPSQRLPKPKPKGRPMAAPLHMALPRVASPQVFDYPPEWQSALPSPVPGRQPIMPGAPRPAMTYTPRFQHLPEPSKSGDAKVAPVDTTGKGTKHSAAAARQTEQKAAPEDGGEEGKRPPPEEPQGENGEIKEIAHGLKEKIDALETTRGKLLSEMREIRSLLTKSVNDELQKFKEKSDGEQHVIDEDI